MNRSVLPATALTVWVLSAATVGVLAGASLTRLPGSHLRATGVSFVAQSASAQATQPTWVEFDVASVKPSAPDGNGPGGISFSPSGRFAWNRMTVKQLLPSAYAELGFKQIAGGPRWLETSRFDIAATSSDALADMGPDGAPRGLFRRLRTLLEDRFGLKAHVEMREVPVYALQPAATPFVAGAGLKKTDVDCEAVIREMATQAPAPRPYGQLPPCSIGSTPGRLRGSSSSIARVADVLSNIVDRPVVDRTGFAGAYDVDLNYAPEFPPGTLVNGAPPPPTDGPSIYTAVREQLGLKLEAVRTAVPVLVIDDAHLPTPD
jgi:uncharacterized protein (TIGR03435 family)